MWGCFPADRPHAVVSTGLSHLPLRLMSEIYGLDTETALRRLIPRRRQRAARGCERRRRFQLWLLMRDRKQKLSFKGEERASSVDKTKQNQAWANAVSFVSIFSQAETEKNEIIYLKRHIFLIRSLSNGCNCVPVVPPPLSKCNESCCL